jgi:hypothetical protein
MSVIAKVSRNVRGNASEAFGKFIDFRNWERFMPDQFRPISGPERQLKPGDRLRMELDTGAFRLKVPVDVFSIDEPREVVWGGGSGLLHARHRFVFRDAGNGTVVIDSDEEWTGLLPRIGPIARRVKRQAEIVAEAQLGGFARWFEG